MENEIIINTKIDTSGIDKGIAEIKTKLGDMSKHTIQVGADFQKSMEDAMSGWGERLETNVRAIANTTANIEEYMNQSRTLGEVTEDNTKKASRFNGVLGAIGSRIRGLGQRLTGPIKQVGNFVKKFLSIAGAIAIFKKLGSTIKGAMSSLEGWGTKTSYLISDYKKSMEYMQNAMGAMFTPIIDVVLPKLITLLDGVANAFNTIGMYIAALMGQKTYTKAVKGVNDYKDAISKTGKAADQAAGSLASFDELTVIQTPQGQQENPFVTEGIPEEIQQIKSLKDLLDQFDFEKLGREAASFADTFVSNLTKKIEDADVNSVVAALTQFVSGFMSDEELFEDIGELGGTIVNKIVDSIDTVFETDPNILDKAVNAFNAFVRGFLTKTDTEKAGEVGGTVVAKVVKAIETGVEGAPVKEAMGKLSDLIWGFVKGLTDELEDFSLIEFFKTVADKIKEGIEGIKTYEIVAALIRIAGAMSAAVVEAIYLLVKTALWTPIELLFDTALTAVEKLGLKLAQSHIPKIRELGENMVTGAQLAKQGIDDAVDAVDKKVEGFAENVKKNANAAADVVVAAGKYEEEQTKATMDRIERDRELHSQKVTQINADEVWQIAMDNANANEIDHANLKNARDERDRIMADSVAKVNSESDKEASKSTQTTNTRVDNDKRAAESAESSSERITNATKNTSSTVTTSYQTMDASVTTNTNDMARKTGSNASSMQSALSNNLQLMQSLMGNKMSTMSSDVSSKTSDMASKTTTNTASMYKSLFDNMSSMAKILQEKMDTMKTQMAVNYMKMNQVTTSATTQMFNTIANMDWYSIGWNVVQGVINGIIGNLPGLLATAANMAVQTVNTVKNRLKIKSPSRVFEDEVGAMIDQGLAIGIEDEAQVPLQAMSDIATSLANTAMNGIQAPMIASGSVLPTQIASGLARADYATGGESTSTVDLLNMLRQMRDQQQDLLETLIEVVDNKNFNLTANATTGRWVNRALKAYQGVTG